MRYWCWITRKSRMQFLFMYKCDWILQNGHDHKKLLLHINATLKCPCLVFKKMSSISLLYPLQAHIYTHLNARVIKMGLLQQTAISALLSAQFGSLCMFFYCFSHTEVQLGHQTWPRANGRLAEIENTKRKLWSKYCHCSLFRELVENCTLCATRSPFQEFNVCLTSREWVNYQHYNSKLLCNLDYLNFNYLITSNYILNPFTHILHQ